MKIKNCLFSVALDICDRPGMKATGLFKHPGVAAHPSDQGMAEIARRLLNAMFPWPSPCLQ